MKWMVEVVLFWGTTFFWQGCAGPDSFGGSREAISVWGQNRGFSANEVIAEPFRLLRLRRQWLNSDEAITIYLEGDGAPWLSSWHPPDDPTPVKPIAMALAAADPQQAVTYFGRPGQYLKNITCSSDYWQKLRFAPEVVAAYNQAFDDLKIETKARHLRLVGYSGGGVLATLLAANRNDVDLLITVAAPLAVSEWIAWHDLSPLVGSLDPNQLDTNIQLPISVHFVGGNDKVVPEKIVKNFIARHGGRLIIVPGFNHECCWSRDWAKLIEHIANEYMR